MQGLRDIFLILRYPGCYAAWLGYRQARWEGGRPALYFRLWLPSYLDEQSPKGYTDKVE